MDPTQTPEIVQSRECSDTLAISNIAPVTQDNISCTRA